MLCGMRAPNKDVWNRRAAPENKPLICPLLSDAEVKQPCLEGPCPAILNEPLTLEQLRKMLDGWVWLVDSEHPGFNGWYTVRPFHGGGDRIEFWGVDNAYYELAITAGSVKVYARKPEGNEP
jgi:hypothetical protein